MNEKLTEKHRLLSHSPPLVALHLSLAAKDKTAITRRQTASSQRIDSAVSISARKSTVYAPRPA